MAAAMRNAHNAILGTMLAQALGCMPMLVGIAIADALMLNHWRGSLLCLFVAVPSAVLYFLTTKQVGPLHNVTYQPN